MGRGVYYRASLGPTLHSLPIPKRTVGPVGPLRPAPTAVDGMVPIETGNISEMTPVNGSDIVQQINNKMALWRLWPCTLVSGLAVSAFVASTQEGQFYTVAVALVTLAVTAFFARWDAQRKTVVIMYDLDDDVIQLFKTFS